MKKSVLILIVFLTALNLWSLAVNFELKNRVSKCRQFNEINSSGSIWGFENAGIENAYLVHPDVYTSRDQLNLLFFFTDLGCSYCIEHEVELLNKLYERHGNRFDVYLFSKNKSFLKRLYNAKFPYKTIMSQDKVLDNEFTFNNPVAIVTDSNGMVQIIHIADKDDKKRSEIFYKRINSLL